MTAKKGISYREELIKEALRRELDSIEPPPPELMWRRIQSRLGQKARAPVPLLRRIAWQRYSAAAAALFIFLLGGLGIYRALQAPDPSMPEITRDNGEVDLLGTENQPAWDFPAGWTPAAEPDPPFRASSIEGDFTFEKARAFAGTEGGPSFLAAVYSRDGERLLYVRAGQPEPALDLFLAELGKALGVTVQVTASAAGRAYFEAGGCPGLAWHADGFTEVLWALSGGLEGVRP